MPRRSISNMSVPVELDELRARVEEYGPVAFLTTVGNARPHIVSVEVGWADGALRAQVGTTTGTNAHTHPAVSLLWAASPGGEYALIVDGHATVEAASDGGPGILILRPERAVLHRLAGAPGDGPNCVTVLSRAGPE